MAASEGSPVTGRGPGQLRRIFEAMVTMRAAGYRHEAIAVGTVSALRPGDFVASWPGRLAAQLWAGADLARVRAGYHGPAPVIREAYSLATGAAALFACRLEDRVALAHCGGQSAAGPGFREAVGYAAALRLPCVFVVRHDEGAQDEPGRRRQADFGLSRATVDGADVLAVRDATAAAAARARAGGGPALIECAAAHWPPDTPERDPVALFESVLFELGVLGPEAAARIRLAARDRASAATWW